MNNVLRQAVEEDVVSIQQIQQHRLPDHLAALVDRYDETVDGRDPFLWKWLHMVLPNVTLSSVPPESAEQVRDAKTVASMFVVLLDDIGEKERDRVTLREASKIPFEAERARLDAPDADRDALALADEFWTRFDGMLDTPPRRDEFAAVLDFDLKQTLNAIHYALLVNEDLSMINLDENWVYGCANMMLFTYLDVDLMYSPSFDRRELAPLRQAVVRAQRLARIGNWITTWERELGEGDFTSGVVVYALENGFVSYEELAALRDDPSQAAVDRVVERIRDQPVEERFLEQWQRYYDEAIEYGDCIDSVDLRDYMDGMKTVLQYHLASRGLK